MTELAGGSLIMSIHPTYQRSLLTGSVPREERIAEQIPRVVQEKLHRLPEFRRAYEPEGLSEKDVITFGPTQRTLARFSEAGWKVLERFQVGS